MTLKERVSRLERLVASLVVTLEAEHEIDCFYEGEPEYEEFGHLADEVYPTKGAKT